MSHVDWDLLADHLGGALAGTPDADRVARLVAADPAWGQAAVDLAGAMATVASDLRAAPAAPPMPRDVAARLDAVLHELAPAPAGPDQPAAPAARAGPDQPAAPAGHAAGRHTAIGGRTGAPAGGRPPARPGPRQRRRRRAVVWGAGAGVAAGVIAFAALGLGSVGLFSALDGDDGAEVAAADAGEAGAEQPLQAGADGPHVIASGTDYRPGSPLFTSRQLARAAPVPDLDRQDEPDTSLEEADGAYAPEHRADDEVPDALARVRAELQPCLEAVLAVHEPAPGQVTLVDLASFEEEPAVVIWLTTADGVQWVWVAGPDCGSPAAGPDQRYQTRLD